MDTTTPVSVLIIDGDAASRNFLTIMLRKSGYIVLAASMGREGLITAWKDLPNVIILDPVLPDLKGLDLVTRLRQDRRTSQVPCVALSSRQDSSDMNALLAAGCNEYMAKSSQALAHLLELIPRLLRGESTSPVKQGILIAFSSAKGGTGTSSLCANIAMSLGSDNIETRVAVVDLVLPVGSIADIVGYKDHLNLVTVASQDPAQITPTYFKDNLPRIPNWYFHLLAGSPDPALATKLAANHIKAILQALLGSYDYVLVDLGRTISPLSLPVLQKADVIALIIGTDLSTSIITKTVWEYLKNQGIDPKRVYPLQNRSVGLEGLTKDEIEQLTGLQIRLTMPYMSGNFTVANNRHEPVIARFPNDSSSLTLKQAALQITELAQKSRPR